MSAEELQILWLSAQVAALAVVVALPLALACAWLLLRLGSFWAALLRGLVLLPLVLPPVVTGYVLLELLGRQSLIGRALHGLFGFHIAYTRLACVIAAAVVGFPLLVESIRLALAAVDPRLAEVSRTLGRGPWATFVRVYLPLAWPGLLAGVVLAFARGLGEFGATIVLAGNIAGETRQIPIAVYTLLNQPGRESEALRLVLLSVGLSLAALLGAALLMQTQSRRQQRSERRPR